MELTFKQRSFSWLGAYDITDKNGDIVYKVKGEPSLTRSLCIYDATGEYLGKVTQKMVALIPHYKLYEGDSEIGEVVKEITLAKPKFTLDCKNWSMTGDILGMNYKLEDGDNVIMTVHKRALRVINETYELEIYNESDALYCVMIMVAMDAAYERADTNNNS